MVSLLLFITVIATEQNLYVFLTLNDVADDTDGLSAKMKPVVSDGVKLMSSVHWWLLCLSETISWRWSSEIASSPL